MRLVISLLFILFSVQASGQNYVDYHRELNKAKLLAVGGQFKAAAELTKLTFEAYEFRYARDCVHGIQMAAKTSDTLLVQFFVEAGLKQGIPLSYLRRMSELNWFKATESWRWIEQNADSLEKIYNSSINAELSDETRKMNDELLELKARPVRGAKWRKLIEQQVDRLVDITREFGFPGERLIGIDTVSLSAGIPIEILTQYYTKARPSNDELFFKQLELGYLYNEHFATICDFQGEFGRKKYDKRGYYGLRFGQKGRKLNYYDAKRQEIGLMTFTEYSKLEKLNLLTKFWKQLK